MATKERASKRKKCRTPGCGNKQQTRELCFGCRAEVSRQIAAGEKTEQEFIDEGLLAPKKRLGRPRENAMAKHLAHAK